MKSKILLSSAFCLLLSLESRADIYLNDDFNDGIINPSLWSVSLPYGDSSVTESGGHVSVSNNGRLTTLAEMPTTYEVDGRFLETANPYDNFKIVIRSDGAPFGSTPGFPTEARGICVMFNVRDDTGATYHNLLIGTIGNLAGDTHTPPITASLALDTWHTFRITDDGYNIALFYDDAVVPTATFQSSFSAGNLITFYNREGNDGRSSISNGGIAELDYLTVVAVPEPSCLVMACLAGLLLISVRSKGK
jgi:hypothetical protein